MTWLSHKSQIVSIRFGGATSPKSKELKKQGLDLFSVCHFFLLTQQVCHQPESYFLYATAPPKLNSYIYCPVIQTKLGQMCARLSHQGLVI